MSHLKPEMQPDILTKDPTTPPGSKWVNNTKHVATELSESKYNTEQFEQQNKRQHRILQENDINATKPISLYEYEQAQVELGHDDVKEAWQEQQERFGHQAQVGPIGNRTGQVPVAKIIDPKTNQIKAINQCNCKDEILENE